MLPVNVTYVQPLVGYGNLSALGGDAKNSEEPLEIYAVRAERVRRF